MKIYTDDKAALRDAVGASSARLSATELTKGAKVKRQAVQVNRLAALAKTHAARAVSLSVKVKDAVKTWAQRIKQEHKPKGMEYE